MQFILDSKEFDYTINKIKKMLEVNIVALIYNCVDELIDSAHIHEQDPKGFKEKIKAFRERFSKL